METWVVATFLLMLSGCSSICDHSLRVGLLPTVLHYSHRGFSSCQWTLYSDTYSHIKLVLQRFKLGPSDCSGSYIEIRDGTVFSSRLAKFCNSSTSPIELTSHGRYLMITFRGATMTSHFRSEYTALDTSVCKGGYHDIGHDNDYHIVLPDRRLPFRETYCYWIFDTGNIRQIVYLKVVASNLKRTSYGCSTGEYMEAHDGWEETFTSLGRWCGTDKPTKESTGRYMYLIFHSSNMGNMTHFSITVSSKNQPIQSTKAGVIAGAVFGVFLLVVSIAFYFWGRKCYRKRSTPSRCVNSTERPTGYTDPCITYGASTSLEGNIYSINVTSGSRRSSELSISDFGVQGNDNLIHANNRSIRSPISSTASASDPPGYSEVVNTAGEEPPSYSQVVDQIVRNNFDHETIQYLPDG